jgi:hypothetical protein
MVISGRVWPVGLLYFLWNRLSKVKYLKSFCFLHCFPTAHSMRFTGIPISCSLRFCSLSPWSLFLSSICHWRHRPCCRRSLTRGCREGFPSKSNIHLSRASSSSDPPLPFLLPVWTTSGTPCPDAPVLIISDSWHMAFVSCRKNS